MKKYLNIVFAGTTFFSASCLEFLLKKYKIIGIITQPDNFLSRKKRKIFNPVKIIAKKANIQLIQPISLNDHYFVSWIHSFDIDLIIVVAYGLIFPKNILNIPKIGCLNLHASLLPRWRGAAPIQRAILSGDKETGITIIKMNSNVDSGNIVYQKKCFIKTNDTTLSLSQKLIKIGKDALLKTIHLLHSGFLIEKKQNNNFVKYAKKIKKKEALINWNFSAKQIERAIRAFILWPKSYFIYNNENIKVLQANVINCNFDLSPGTVIKVDKNGIQIITGNGILEIIKLQPSGKRIMSVKSFLNSRYDIFYPGMIL
ncbi:MAG: methionyl-tRNA formyltransferase [Arsenophonus sp.]|nr:MAG: methionyl-tRNA formyltransferase [Arsenophonus sp.]